MLTNYHSAIHDEPIEVFVGPEKIPFRVSPLLLAEQSDPLNAMVSNGMKESQEKVAYLPEEEPEIFQYFLDWGLFGAYRVLQTGVKGRGEYSVNDMCQVEELPPFKTAGAPGNLTHFYCKTCREYRCMPVEVMSRWWCNACQLASRSPGECPKCKNYRELDSTFITKCESDGCPGEAFDENKLKRSLTVTSRRQSFWQSLWQQFDLRDRYGVGPYTHAEVQDLIARAHHQVPKSWNFVAHAKVFVFAEKWLIKDLQELAVHLLHRDLTPCYQVGLCDPQNVIDLITYIYENGEQDPGCNDVSPLKELALEYVTINAIHLLRCEEFCDLLSEGGEFAVELAKIQAKHLF